MASSSNRNLQEDENQEPNKKRKFNDRISSLDDNVLSSIISLLPPSEAACTFALSKHWLTVWKTVLGTVVQLSIIPDVPLRTPYNFVKDLKMELKNSEILNDQMVAFALSNFPNLREFRLIGSLFVHDLTISCTTLKKLEILSCNELKSLRFMTPELVSFKYNGPDVEYHFQDVPKLAEFSLLPPYCYDLAERNFVQIGLIMDQIVKLNFSLGSSWRQSVALEVPFKRVRALWIDATVLEPLNLEIFFETLLKLTPNANMVLMHLFWPEERVVSDTSSAAESDDDDATSDEEEFSDDDATSDEEESDEDGDNLETEDEENLEMEDEYVEIMPSDEDKEYPPLDIPRDMKKYLELKLFELVGCTGHKVEGQLLEVLLEAAKSVKRVVIRVGRRAPSNSNEDLMDANERENAITDARKTIQRLLPPGTEYQVL